MANRNVIPTPNASKAVRRKPEYSALVRFADWLDANGGSWIKPDLKGFVYYLASKQPDKSWIELHLDAIRARYQGLEAEQRLVILGIASGETSNSAQMKSRIAEINSQVKAVAKTEVDIDAVIQIVKSVSDQMPHRSRHNEGETYDPHSYHANERTANSYGASSSSHFSLANLDCRPDALTQEDTTGEE